MASHERDTSMEVSPEVRVASLHDAAKTGERDSFSDLIKKGWDPYMEDKDGANALQVACLHGKYTMVRWLAKKYPELKTKINNYGDTSLHYAAAGGNVAVFAVLNESSNLEKDLVHQRNNEGESVLHKACLHGKYDMVKNLVRNFPNLAAASGANDWNILHYAAASGNIDIFQYFTYRIRTDPNMTQVEECFTNDGKTVLHIACMYSKYDTVVHLLQNFPNLKTKADNDGFSPLHAAALAGDIEIFKLLVEEGLDYSIVTKDGWNILHAACMKPKNNILPYLVETYPSLIIAEDKNGSLAIQFAAEDGLTEEFQMMARQGMDVVCSKGVSEMVSYLDKMSLALMYIQATEQLQTEEQTNTVEESMPDAPSENELKRRISSFIMSQDSSVSNGFNPQLRRSSRKRHAPSCLSVSDSGKPVPRQVQRLRQSDSSQSSGYFSSELSSRSHPRSDLSVSDSSKLVPQHFRRSEKSDLSQSSGYFSIASSTRGQTFSDLSIPGSSSGHEIPTAAEEAWSEDIPFLIPSMVRTYIKDKGNKSQEVASLLQWFCMRAKIKHYHQKQVDISPGYYMDKPDEPILLAIVGTEPEDVPDASDSFTFVVRREDEVSPEGKDIVAMEMEKNLHFTEEEQVKVHKCLRENSRKLMAKHSNLEIVSASKIKSKRHGKEDAETKEVACIVLYVHVKGIIPFAEEPFPEEIDGFPVDVREGLFEPHTLAAGYHEQLLMGCQIASTYGKCGTLGGFVELANGNVGGLTCLHIFLSVESAIDLNKTHPLSHGSFRREVYQPDNSTERFKFGIVRDEVLEAGTDENDIGVDAALIEISDADRLPVNGNFPNATSEVTGFNERQPMVFKSGKIVQGFQEVKLPCTVIKYGKSTGHTMGMLRLEGPAVYKRKCKYAIGTSPSGVLELSNQFEVFHMNNQPFSAPGDSGALVFLVSIHGETHDIRALGMVVGGTTHNTTFVTPIWAVLDKLGLPRRLLRFSGSRISAGTQTSGNLQSEIKSDPAFVQLKEDVSVLKRVTSTMQKQLEENTKTIGIVREKLDDVKRSVDSKIDDLKNDLLQALSQNNQETRSDSKSKEGSV